MRGNPHTRSACVAGVLVCALSAGSAYAQPPPAPLTILDVPFVSQSEALCGGAAAAMVLRYWGEHGLDAESFAHLVDRSAAGIRTDRLVEELRARGWQAIPVAGTEELIAAELARGRPVLTLIEDRPGTYHYVVIVASTPQAIVFHDPARAPFRVMEREQFARRWSAADRWMTVVVPGEPSRSLPPPSVEPARDDATCDGLMAAGVGHAQAGDLEAAERALTAALPCGGSASLRELAGVRLLQRRWPEVAELASAALAADPADAHAWQLLATSRFVQGDPEGALRAWNRIDQPRVDLVGVRGLTRTRQRVVERLLAVPSRALLTPGRFEVSARRLEELPSAESTRLELVPISSGIVELRAHIVERPLAPADAWSYAALGLMALARNEVGVTLGSFTGGGEHFDAGWRFWPGRPRVHLGISAPARWGVLWGVSAFAERQPFSDDLFPPARRAGARVGVSNWINPWTRVSGAIGAHSWEGRGGYGVLTGGLRLASSRNRVVVELEGSGWSGPERFAAMSASTELRSTNQHRGRVMIARLGASIASAATPPDIWFGGDNGTARPALLRAHPIVDDGMLRADRIGREISHVSGEARQWWYAGVPVRLGMAVFADAARVSDRITPGARRDVDVGAGFRLGLPGMEGVFRLDWAKGLRDGATAVSFVYER